MNGRKLEVDTQVDAFGEQVTAVGHEWRRLTNE